MSRLPQRQSLPTQTAEIMLEMIKSGELAGTLPGERTLASQMQIGRDTLRAALDILETQNYISARKHGRRREIITQSEGARKNRPRRIAFVSPKGLQELSPWMLIEIDTLRELLNTRGYELELLTPGVFQINNPALQLESLMKDKHFDVWILYQCPLSVQQWFQNKKLPAIIRGYPTEGINIPCIDEDWYASAFHAGGLLARLGHRSVGLLMPDTKLSGLKAAEAGLRQAIEPAQVAGNVHLMVDQIHQGSVHRALERAFQLESPPTAFVGTRSRHTLTLISWLAQRGMSIPRDASYISLSYEHWYVHLTPSIAHYHSEPATFAKDTAKKAIAIAEGRKTQSLKLLIPEYTEGNSISKL